jgi:hypothetical protein
VNLKKLLKIFSRPPENKAFPLHPPYQSPEEAVLGLIEAYRTFDVERVIENKDFDIDSRLFWEGLGLPVSSEQLVEARTAFETNFRNQMKEKFPDYRSIDFRIVSEERPQPNFSLVTIEGTTPNRKRRTLRIPLYLTELGWRVVLHPSYDHL